MPFRRFRRLYEEGESMTALKVMRSAGINPRTGEVFIRDGQLTYEYDYREKAVSDMTPKVQGSFRFSFGWRAFDLSATFAYASGHGLQPDSRHEGRGTDPTANADRRVFYDRLEGCPATGRSTRTSPAGRPRLRPTGSSLRSMPLKVRRSNSPIRCRTALPPSLVAHPRGGLDGRFVQYPDHPPRTRSDYPLRVFQASLTVNL